MGIARSSSRLVNGCENVYVEGPRWSGLSRVVWFCSRLGALRAIDSAQLRMLRSVHCLSRWLHCSMVSLGAAVSPVVKIITVSLTSGDGVVSVPSLERSPGDGSAP